MSYLIHAKRSREAVLCLWIKIRLFPSPLYFFHINICRIIMVGSWAKLWHRLRRNNYGSVHLIDNIEAIIPRRSLVSHTISKSTASSAAVGVRRVWPQTQTRITSCNGCRREDRKNCERSRDNAHSSLLIDYWMVSSKQQVLALRDEYIHTVVIVNVTASINQSSSSVAEASATRRPTIFCRW